MHHAAAVLHPDAVRLIRWPQKTIAKGLRRTETWLPGMVAPEEHRPWPEGMDMVRNYGILVSVGAGLLVAADQASA